MLTGSAETIERHIGNCTKADQAYGDGVRAAIDALNAAGLDATTVLAELHRRLENAPDAEAAEVARELRGIALRRLARVLELELEDELAERQS